MFLQLVFLLYTFASTQGVQTSCEAQAVHPGEPATIQCHFPTDISVEKRSFLVHKYRTDSTPEEILSCIWVNNNNNLTCDMDKRYKYDHKVTDRLQLDIPSASEEYVGRYVCQLMPAELTDFVACNFTLKDQSIQNETIDDKGGEDQSIQNKTIDDQGGEDVSTVVIVVVALVCVVLFGAAAVACFMCRDKLPARVRNRLPSNCGERQSNCATNIRSRMPVCCDSPAQEETEIRGAQAKGDNGQPDQQPADETKALMYEGEAEKETEGAFHRALEELENGGVVILKGPEKCGKSSTGNSILEHYRAKNYTPMTVQHTQHYRQHKNKELENAIVLFDCFGVDSSELPDAIYLWSPRIRKMREKEWKVVVLVPSDSKDAILPSYLEQFPQIYMPETTEYEQVS